MNQDTSDPAPGRTDTERPLEADEADVLDQQLPPTGEAETRGLPDEVPADVSEADALDQQREVDLDDEGRELY